METPSQLKEPHPIFLYSVMGYFINASKSTTFERHIEIKGGFSDHIIQQSVLW